MSIIPPSCFCLLIIKPTRCTNFSNLFLEQNSACFRQFLCPSSGVFHCTHSRPVWHMPLLCVQWKIPDDGQRNCPKHVEFYSKNKFEKLVHLVGFIIRIYHATRSPEHHIYLPVYHCTWYHFPEDSDLNLDWIGLFPSRCVPVTNVLNVFTQHTNNICKSTTG